MGADNRQNVQNQRDFQAQTVFSKNGGLAPAGEKCEFPREKCDRYGFHRLKRPAILLKRGETMSKTSETTWENSETAHNAPKASRKNHHR
jgi:hypothetical protein